MAQRRDGACSGRAGVCQMDTMISINIIRRAGVFIAALSAALLILAACSSGGGSAPTPLTPRHALLPAATPTPQRTPAHELLASLGLKGPPSHTPTRISP